MTEKDLHEYNKWLTEVWNPNQLHIPFMKDAPSAFIKYRDEQLRLHLVVGQSEQLKAFADYAQKKMWEDGDKDLSEFVDEFLSL
jgi:outer membrane usher protein FimD/PapC